MKETPAPVSSSMKRGVPFSLTGTSMPLLPEPKLHSEVENGSTESWELTWEGSVSSTLLTFCGLLLHTSVASVIPVFALRAGITHLPAAEAFWRAVVVFVARGERFALGLPGRLALFWGMSITTISWLHLVYWSCTILRKRSHVLFCSPGA